MSNKNPTKIGTQARYVPRDLEVVLKKYLDVPHIVAVVGPRRSGKTTLLLHLKENLPNSAFLSFEDENLLTLFENDIKSFARLYIKPYQNIILDEFQYAKKGGKNLKYLFDFYPGKKIIISGSSSIELTIKAAKYLVGRVLSFPLYPFSFKEFLRANNPQLEEVVAAEKKPSSDLVKQVEPYLNEYLIYGGYPEVVLVEDFSVKQTLLQNIYQLYFLKDVAKLAQLVEDWKLKTLVKILAANVGGMVNYTQLAAEANIDFKTLKSYLNFLEKTFIILPISPFFTNKTKEITKNPKVYFWDLGLRNALINYFEPALLRRDMGFLFENFVAIYLASSKQKANLRFWRTKAKAEVDFVVTGKETTMPIEVKSSLNQAKLSRSLRSFLLRYEPEEAFIANLNVFGQKKLENTKVHFVPVFSEFLKF